MYRIKPCRDMETLYRYQQALDHPYNFPVSFPEWCASLFHDVDGRGKPLFSQLCTRAAYNSERIAGFVQYGLTACGFDRSGALTDTVSYPVIRMLSFDDEAAGKALLDTALQELPAGETVYAFYHYFGASCNARHGKLYETQTHVAALLKAYDFQVEHQNVYYKLDLSAQVSPEITLSPDERTPGGQQTFRFLLGTEPVGECELHYVKPQEIAYLRWFGIRNDLRHRGIGSDCMRRLIRYLYSEGYRRLDTDTAITNEIAQKFYEKNGFHRMGVTRSYYRQAATKME